MTNPLTSPRDLDELRLRAGALEGLTLDDVARTLGTVAPKVNVHTKGKVGALVERALGATGGSSAVHDFPHLAVELKTVPVVRAPSGELKPRESTYVCRISLDDADRAEWATSWARAKLSHVLFVPVVDETTIARPVFWKPTLDEDALLRADFEELMGTIGAGRIEELTARDGVVLQVRPKAKDGSVRTIAYDRDGDVVSTVPRGFYLRARFVGSLIQTSARDTELA